MVAPRALTIRRLMAATFWFALACGCWRLGPSDLTRDPSVPQDPILFYQDVLLIQGFAATGAGVGVLFGHPLLGAVVAVPLFCFGVAFGKLGAENGYGGLSYVVAVGAALFALVLIVSRGPAWVERQRQIRAPYTGPPEHDPLCDL